MTWNYRLVRHLDGSHALHEVYYDEAGQPRAMTERPIYFLVGDDETPADLIASLETALRDARERPILGVEEIAPSC